MFILNSLLWCIKIRIFFLSLEYTFIIIAIVRPFRTVGGLQVP
jgi:hypothetical protein